MESIQTGSGGRKEIGGVMNFSDSLMYYGREYRKFHRDMKEWEKTTPKEYGEYLQGKRRKKKRKNK
jgi:hypothetical protein